MSVAKDQEIFGQSRVEERERKIIRKRRGQPAIGDTMQDPPVQRCLEVASRQLRPFSKKPCSEEFSDEVDDVDSGDAGGAGGVGVAATATGSDFCDNCWVTSTGVSLVGALFFRTGSSVLISSTSSSSSVSSKSNELMRDFMSFSVQETDPQCRRK